MAIDPLHELLISLTEASRLFPRNARGKHPHVASLYRYTAKGCRGVVLESVQAGAVRSTTPEAVARFIQRLTEQVELPTDRPSASDVGRAAADAGAVLDATFFASSSKGRAGCPSGAIPQTKEN
jgi:hypothetical protein